MRKLRNHKEQLIERLKDSEYASAYFNQKVPSSFALSNEPYCRSNRDYGKK